MNQYVMYDTPTESGEAVEPRVLAKCYGRVEAEMLNALLKYESPFEKNATWGPRIFIVRESELDHEHAHRRAVAGFEVDGPDPKDAAEIEILRAALGRFEDDGDLRRPMIQRVLVEDAGYDHWWKDKMLDWILKGGHTEGMEAFERRLVKEKAEHDKWMEQMQAEHEARQGT